MLKRPMPSKLRSIAGLSLVLALSLAGGWTAWAAQPARIADPAKPQAVDPGDGNVSASSEAISIRDAALQVASQASLRLANPEVLAADQTIAFKFEDIPAATALQLIAEEAGMVLHIDGDTVSFESLQKPRYPVGDPAASQGGLVMLKVLVGTDGHPREVRYLADKSTVSEGSEFTRNALEAAAKWRFIPTLKDGKAVQAWVVVPVRFEPPSVQDTDSEA